MIGSIFSKLALAISGLIASILVAAGIFWLVFLKYEEFETKIYQGLLAYASELYDILDRMFKRKPLNTCYAMILIPTGVLGFTGLLIGLRFGFIFGIIGGGLLGMIGFRAPGVIIKGMFERRVQKFDRQLVDALNMMANAIKSGLSFMQVVSVIEREMPAPCSEEFAMVLKENRVGINLNDALMNMSNRIPSEDLFMIINSVVTLSQQGGDLSEAFDTIAKTIRERQRVLEKIRTLAQAGLTQGAILSLLPLVMLVLQYFIQPAYVRLLMTTPLGLGMFFGMLFLMGVGAFWMKKILTIEV